MSKYTCFTNAVDKDASRVVHLEVLKKVSDIVMKTAGPKGSTAMIMQGNNYPLYSKDGKKVLENIKLFGEVETGILDQLVQIVQEVVRRVGDGTTSAVRLTYLIFKELVALEENPNFSMNNHEIIYWFKKAVEAISEEIIKNKRDLSEKDVYDICMISTNGDETLSTTIMDIYAKYGKNVYIDLKSSNVSDYLIKEYDGLTLNKGFATPAYINRPGEICDLRNIRIYVFKDPIDTPEMIGFFTRIVYDNILTPFNNLKTISQLQRDPRALQRMSETELNKLEKNSEMIPTLIMCPFMSRDLSSVLETLESLLYSFDKDATMRVQKPPIAIVNNLSRNIDELSDISLLCGCKVIGKYIDESVQAADIEAGKAPTIDNVTEFYGVADEVVIDKEKTRFINPLNMFEKDEDGNVVKDEETGNPVYSNTFNALVSFLTGQLEESERLQDSVSELNRLKRRLSGLTAGLVELYIGGISVTDRESTKDLADDAIRNCRSAAVNGVGMAANFEGLMATRNVKNLPEKTKLFVKIIENAYTDIIKELYSTCFPHDNVDDEFDRSIKMGKPCNLRTSRYTDDVVTSIDTDITILDCISRIVTIMFTSNQILIGSAFENRYAEIDK